MKKIIVLLILLFVSIPTFAMEIKTFDIRETYFKNDIKTYQNKTWGNLSIKGVWSDPKNNLKSVLVEELFCDIGNMICTSSVVDLSFIGTPALPPYLDVYGLTYKVIGYTSNKIKLFCSFFHFYDSELSFAQQQFLYFFPLPQGQSSFLPAFDFSFTTVC